MTRGRSGLTARPHPGHHARLSPEQWQQLGDLLQAGALAWGFDTERWTVRRVAEVIRERFGVTYNPISLLGSAANTDASARLALVRQFHRETVPDLQVLIGRYVRAEELR
jgi:hypothetical protein